MADEWDRSAQEIVMKTLERVVAESSLEPRPYQFRIVGKSVNLFLGRHQNQRGETESAAKSVLIESPTGSGKTSMGLLAARTLQQELGDDLVVCWTAMRRNLLAQAEAENLNKGIGVRNFFPTSMFVNDPSAVLEARRGRKLLMVPDEAQHDAASSMTHLHNVLQPDFILGLSATPYRVDRVKLCFDKVIKDAGIHQLIQDGYLSQYDHYTIPAWTPQVIFDQYTRCPERWGKSAFYFNRLDHCWELHRLFQKAGFQSHVVTGDTDWETQLSEFREGVVPLVINCMKLTEGWDEPSLQTTWVRDSGKGPTIQMAGRVFRKDKRIPKKQVVQSKQTRWPMIRTAMPTAQYVWQNDTWLSLTVNPEINAINLAARYAIATTPVELPTFVTSRKGKSKKVRF
jgi:superfamily II DNA or RNA helicase